MPRIESDFLELLVACAEKRLDKTDLKISKKTCSTVILASKGYPGDYTKGKSIEIQSKLKNAIVFHAGTKLENQQELTNGGRVLAVSAIGLNMKDALKKSYQMVDNIHFEGKQFRRDIGFDL
jgi:phosphoribosylamine---glycine ligase